MTTFKDKSISTLSDLSRKLVEKQNNEVEFVTILFEKIYKEYLKYFEPIEGKNVYIEFKRKNGRTQVDEWYGFYLVYNDEVLSIYTDNIQHISSRSKPEICVKFNSKVFKKGTFSKHLSLLDKQDALNRIYKEKSFLWFAYREPEELFSQLRIGLIDTIKSTCIEKGIDVDAQKNK